MSKPKHFRSQARPQVACKVILRRQDPLEDGLVSFTRDLGPGGLFAITDAIFEMGDRIQVELSTPSTWEPLTLDAQVCRIEEAEGGEPGGVAVQFVDMTDAQILALSDFIDSLEFER